MKSCLLLACAPLWSVATTAEMNVVENRSLPLISKFPKLFQNIFLIVIISLSSV